MTKIDETILAKAASIFAAQCERQVDKMHLNAIVMGHPGTGKTSLALTCPKPVLIDSFDSKGTVTRRLRPLIESGDILVRDYELDSWHRPTAFRRWEKETEQLIKADFFSHIGTYILDSYTSWSRKMMYAIIARGVTGQKSDHTPSQTDYKVMLYTVVHYINIISALPCHTLMLAHLALTKDDVTGGHEVGLLAPPSQRGEIPSTFVEKWYTRIVGKNRYVLQIHGDGKWKASSRFGGDALQEQEPQDIKAILKKCGLSAEDKPRLIEKEVK